MSKFFSSKKQKVEENKQKAVSWLTKKEEEFDRYIAHKLALLEKRYNQVKKAAKITRKVFRILFRLVRFSIQIGASLVKWLIYLLIFLIQISPYLLILFLLWVIAFIAYALIVTLYYTQLMPIMSIKVKIDNHWLQNYIYSSDLKDFEWKATWKNTTTNKDAKLKKDILDAFWDSVMDYVKALQKEKEIKKETEKNSNVFSNIFQQIKIFSLNQLASAIKNKAEIQNSSLWLSKWWDDCIIEFSKNNTTKWEEQFIECVKTKTNPKILNKSIELEEGSWTILKQAEINVYSILQMKWIGTAYLKNFSNFCTASWNLIRQAENNVSFDSYDIEKVNEYLNTPYFLGRDVLTWLYALNSWWAVEIGSNSHFNFLLELHSLARLVNHKNNKVKNKDAYSLYPTLDFLLNKSLEENFFASRLWESYFFPLPRDLKAKESDFNKDSFIAYKRSSGNNVRWFSQELMFYPWQKINEQSLFEKNIFKTKEEEERNKQELTPEMKKFKEFYESTCSTKNIDSFVRMNFINTNGFALNKIGFSKMFVTKEYSHTAFKSFNEEYRKAISNYWDTIAKTSFQAQAYEFFNQPLSERIKSTSNITWVDEYQNIKGLYHKKNFFFYNNFFFNNISINSTDALKALSQLLSQWWKEKVESLKHQLNLVWEVDEYDQIVKKLHSMYWLKWTISGKYFVMDYSPLENIYKADPVYWSVTVMNPFPSYNVQFEINDTSINNQDFFNKINGSAINKKKDGMYNIPYINIDITSLALELWYTWESPIIVKYYVYWIRQNDNDIAWEQYYDDKAKHFKEITLTYNSEAKSLGTYQMISNSWQKQTKVDRVFNANPFVYFNQADDVSKALYSWLWYNQLKKDFLAWTDKLRATYNGFGDDVQIREKLWIDAYENKLFLKDNVSHTYKTKVNKATSEYIESAWFTDKTKNINQKEFLARYDSTPKKITFCISNPIVINKKMPVVNINLYQMMQNNGFNFINPTTYQLNKLYSICMDIDNVYMRNSDYLHYLRGNNYLNSTFKIMWKWNMVFTNLYLKEYIPSNKRWIINQEQIYDLKENALLNKLEKKQIKMISFNDQYESSNTAYNVIWWKAILPFCQFEFLPKIIKKNNNSNNSKIVEKAIYNTKLLPFENTFLFHFLNKSEKYDSTIKSLFKPFYENTHTPFSIRKWYNYYDASTFFRDKTTSEKNMKILMQEYLDWSLLSKWSKKYRKKIGKPLYDYFRTHKQSWEVRKLLNTDMNVQTLIWTNKLESSLWQELWLSDWSQYMIKDIAIKCFDQSNQEKHVSPIFWITNLKSYLLWDTSEYLDSTKKKDIKKWVSDITPEYWEFFYNPSISYIPIKQFKETITDEKEAKEFDSFLRSHLFYQVKYGNATIKQRRDAIQQMKQMEVFLHLWTGIYWASVFESKGNKYFDYIDNLLGKSWWGRYNLIFADGNKYFLKLSENIKILNQQQNNFIHQYIKEAGDNFKEPLKAIFEETANKQPWWEENMKALLWYFYAKQKNFTYSLLMENNIQPTYYDYFWSSSSNSQWLGSSLHYFQESFNKGLKKEMHPFYRLDYLDALDRSNYKFEAQENTQYILSKINANHYFNALWWKYFSTQQKNLAMYSDVYSPFQKYSKIFWKENVIDTNLYYADNTIVNIKEKNIKDKPSQFPLSYLSMYGNNFFLLWDFLNDFYHYRMQLGRNWQYPFFKNRYYQYLKNLDIEDWRIAQASSFLERLRLNVWSWFNSETKDVKKLLKGLLESTKEQANYNYNLAFILKEKATGVDDDLIFDIKKVNKEQQKLINDRKVGVREYIDRASFINNQLWFENGLNAYLDLQMHSLQENRYIEYPELNQNYLDLFYSLFYDENKVQEKIINYIQNVEAKKRYNDVYNAVLDEIDADTYVSNEKQKQSINIVQLLNNFNKDNHNIVKYSYLNAFNKDYFNENMLYYFDTYWFWQFNKVLNKKNPKNHPYSKIKSDYEKALEEYQQAQKNKSTTKEKMNEIEEKKHKAEMIYLKHFTNKSELQQYLSLLEHNLYINPIVSLFKKLPDEYGLEYFEKGKVEMSKLEKAFNSYIIFSNLGNDIKSSPIFEIESKQEELVKPLMKLFNPNLSYVLQHLVDKTLIEIKTTKDVKDETLTASLSHNYTNFWESYWKLWASSTISTIRTEQIINNFIKRMYNQKEIFKDQWIIQLLIDVFFKKEQNMYIMFRQYLPHWKILPSEANTVRAWNTYYDNFAKTLKQYNKAKEKAYETIKDWKYSADDFLTPYNKEMEWVWTRSTETFSPPGDWRNVLMWGLIRQLNEVFYTEQQIKNIFSAYWVEQPKVVTDEEIDNVMRSQFYKNKLWFSSSSEDLTYFYSPLSPYEAITWQNAYDFDWAAAKYFWPLWEDLTQDIKSNEKENKVSTLTKSLRHWKKENQQQYPEWKVSQAQKVLWDTVIWFTELDLPSQAMKSWISHIYENQKYGLIESTNVWVKGVFQDNIYFYLTLVKDWLQHIPFFQHHYLSTLLKLKLQDTTSNPWENYKLWTNNILNLLNDKLMKKTYQRDIQKYLASLSNVEFIDDSAMEWLSKSEIQKLKKSQALKSFAFKSDEKLKERYLKAVITYETWKSQLLQDATLLRKKYNSAEHNAKKWDILLTAYPSAYKGKEWMLYRSKKESYEAIIDSTLWYYEKQAQQSLMSLWWSYNYQRYYLAKGMFNAALRSFKKVWLFRVIKEWIESALNVLSLDTTLDYWVSSSVNYSDALKKQIENNFNLTLLRQDIKQKGFWFFAESEKKKDPKFLFELLNGNHLKTWFYTYLLMLREIIEPDTRERHIQAMKDEQWAITWWFNSIFNIETWPTKQQRYWLLSQLGLIDMKEMFYITSKEEVINKNIKVITEELKIETPVNSAEEVIKIVDERIQSRLRQYAKVIDWVLLIANMNSNYQDSTMDEQLLYSDSALWLQDYSKMLGEPMAINDFILYLYGADFIEAKEQFGNQKDFYKNVIQNIKTNKDADIWTLALEEREKSIPILSTNEVELDKNINQESSQKARSYLIDKIPFISFLSYYSLYTYDKLNINYDLYYQRYIEQERQANWKHFFNTTLQSRYTSSDIISTYVFHTIIEWWSKILKIGIWNIDPSNLWFEQKKHWVQLNQLSVLFDIYMDLAPMLFSQGRKFNEDFVKKDLWILTEYIRLNDYIRWLYAWNENLEWLRESVDVNQVDEKTIANSYTLGQNLQVNNFAVLNYILSQKKYLDTHFYPWNTLDKFTEKNKLNVIAFNYFSYEDEKWNIDNAKNILNALQNWVLEDGFDTGKTDWEWFVLGLDNISCKTNSECARIINEAKTLDWWGSFNEMIKREIKKIEDKYWKQDKKDKTDEDTLKALRELIGRMIWEWMDLSKFQAWWRDQPWIPAWDLIGFWENEKASCKQKYPNMWSVEFKTCMSDAIFASEISKKAAWWSKIQVYHWQCTWWSNILRMWNFPDTKWIRFQWDWKVVYNTMGSLKDIWTKNSPTTYSVNWINKYWSNTSYWWNALRYCQVWKYDIEKYVPNMIFSQNETSTNPHWHTWYVVDIWACNSYQSCYLSTLESNALEKKNIWKTYNGSALPWSVAYPYKYNFRYTIAKVSSYLDRSNLLIWFVDLNRPYTQEMVKEIYWNLNDETIKQFCNDYATNIARFAN